MQHHQRRYIMTLSWVTITIMTLLLSFLYITVGCFTTSASAAATGTPVDFVTIADYSDSLQGQFLNVIASGTNFSMAVNNDLRDGVNGHPLRLVVRNNGDDKSLTSSMLAEAFQTYPTAIAVVTSIISLEQEMDYIVANNITIIQPTLYSRESFKFNRSLANFIPAPDTELFAMVRHAVYSHQVSRVAVIVEELDGINDGKLSVVTTMIKSVGATLTYVLYINAITNPNGFDTAKMQELFATNPHAVILLGNIFPNSASVLLALVVSLPTTRVYMSSSMLPLADPALRQVAGLPIADRVFISALAPLYTDPSSNMIKRFREEVAAHAEPAFSLAVIDANPSTGMYFFFGWIMGEIMHRVASSLRTLDSQTLYRDIFADAIYTIDDYVLGPFGGPCSGQRTQFCSCNNGCRFSSLMSYTDELVLVSVADSSFTLPYTSCDGIGLPLQSILVVAVPSPASSPEAARIVSDFLLGRNAAASTGGDITVDGALIQQTYTGNSTAALQTLNTERLLTASAGAVLNIPVEGSIGLGAVLDPVEVRPRLYGGYRRDVVHVTPIYEQELHALASFAIGRGMSIRVLSALDDGDAVGTTLTMSMHTLGKEGGGSRTVSTIADGLGSTADGVVTILHGIATSADIAAIATYLGRTSSGIVAVPMAHLLAWYGELLSAIPDDTQRTRIVLATSLPNWAGPVSDVATGPALQTYFDQVPPSNRTPGSLRGYMTHQFLLYVSSRIPTVKSSDQYLQMVYGASVIVMDTGLVAGPYFDTTCTGSGETTCEMNIGARLIRVRSLFAAVNATSDSSTVSLDSGRIAYTALPTADNTLNNIIIIVVVVGGLLILGGTAIVVLVCCCSGRSNWTAPKDESEAFTIIFTDIQSSTTLWAEAPEAMAPALDHHHVLIRKLCKKHRGYEVKTIGDAFMIAFEHAVDAVDLSSALQFDFYNDDSWSPQIDHAYLEMDHISTGNLKLEEKAMYSLSLSSDDYGKVWNGLRVRIGIHTGYGEIKRDPVSHGYDYYGTVVNTAARTESIAHGGQVILTEAALAASGIPDGRVLEMGPVMLRGVPEPVKMYQLTTVANRLFPPLRVEKALEEDDEILLNAEAKTTTSGSKPSSSLYHDATQLPSTPSSALLLPPGPSASARKYKGLVQGLLRTTFSVLAESSRERVLAELCTRWRVKPLPPSNTSSLLSSSPSPQHQSKKKDLMMDALATTVAPVWARKAGGDLARGGSFRAESVGSRSVGTCDDINHSISSVGQHPSNLFASQGELALTPVSTGLIVETGRDVFYPGQRAPVAADGIPINGFTSMSESLGFGSLGSGFGEGVSQQDRRELLNTSHTS